MHPGRVRYCCAAGRISEYYCCFWSNGLAAVSPANVIVLSRAESEITIIVLYVVVIIYTSDFKVIIIIYIQNYILCCIVQRGHIAIICICMRIIIRCVYCTEYYKIIQLHNNTNIHGVVKYVFLT